MWTKIFEKTNVTQTRGSSLVDNWFWFGLVTTSLEPGLIFNTEWNPKQNQNSFWKNWTQIHIPYSIYEWNRESKQNQNSFWKNWTQIHIPYSIYEWNRESNQNQNSFWKNWTQIHIPYSIYEWNRESGNLF